MSTDVEIQNTLKTNGKEPAFLVRFKFEDSINLFYVNKRIKKFKVYFIFKFAFSVTSKS